MLLSLLLAGVLALDPTPQEPSELRGPAFAEAVQAADEGRDADALVAFQRLAAVNPDDRQARLWIARLHARMGHQSLAEAVYRSVLLEDPGSIDAMLGVAAALLWRDEPDEAIELLDAAEQLAPANDEVLAELGRAHGYAGESARAIAYFERAVSIAPTGQHRRALETARLSYLHRVETRGSSEQFNGTTPDSRIGDLTVNVRLTDRWRVIGRGQAQRKFRESEQRGGGGAEWRWKQATTLRAHAIVGPDNLVMPEGDYLGEVRHTHRTATWSASVRFFDFTGARTTVVSPAVAWTPRLPWSPEGRVSVALRYALSSTEANTTAAGGTGHSIHLHTVYRLYPRVAIQAAYAGGVEDFETFSIDQVGAFRANTVSGGVRVDLRTLTTVVGNYEHQWRRGSVTMGRVTLSLLQSF